MLSLDYFGIMIRMIHDSSKWSVLLLLVALPLYAQTAKDVGKKGFPSVVLLVMEDSNGQPLSLGSGFFVRPGLIATNRHVIEGATRGYSKLVGEKEKHEILGFTAIDEKHDLVLLSIQYSKPPTLHVADNRQPDIGEPVFVIGNPMGLEGTLSEGIISGIRSFEEDTLLQITAPISPGSSGGPVLNGNGEVIGVAVATFRGGQNLNFAIPSRYLTLLVSEMKPLAALSTQKKVQSTSSGHFGGKSSDGVIGVQFLWEQYCAGCFSFSLRNLLRVPVKEVFCLIVFYDKNKEPIEVFPFTYKGVILPGLARRIDREVVSPSVQKLTTTDGQTTPSTEVEFRVLDFKFAK